MIDPVIQLKCSCNNTPFGKHGHDSLAARYCSQTPDALIIKDDTPYAEMWMGTYPALPSRVLSTDKPLQDVLNANKDSLLGSAVLSKFGTDLPFLPKILSIAKALPLQIHPDKDLAFRLHAKNPDKFTDENHKPEIAIALSDFETFVGFKPVNDIQHLFTSLRPLHIFLPQQSEQKEFDDETIRRICGSILSAPADTVSKVQTDLIKLTRSDYPQNQQYVLDLLPRLQEQYSSLDPGNLVALLLMNFLQLSPGECIYVPANGIHAYLSGDIVECMARSNNVINTGFCPAADRDSVDLFTSALIFQQHDPQEPLLKKQKSEKSSAGKTEVIRPPMGEFDMLITHLAAGEKETVKEVMGPSVMIVTKGAGKMKARGKEYEVREGWVFFVGCGVEVDLEAHGDEGLNIYRAYAE